LSIIGPGTGNIIGAKTCVPNREKEGVDFRRTLAGQGKKTSERLLKYFKRFGKGKKVGGYQ